MLLLISGLQLSRVSDAAPTCEAVTHTEATLARFREAITDLDGAIWPGWDTASTPTGALIGDAPWVAWLSAPTADSSISCGSTAGVGRAKWVYRSLSGTSAIAQIDTRRRPALAILVDLTNDAWADRDWLAIYAHELFHVYQFSVMDKARLQSVGLRELRRAWAQERDQIEPALHAELKAGWQVLAGGAELQTYLEARRAREDLLASIDDSLLEASRLMEEFEGVARYIEVSTEIDPEATEPFGGPRDPAEALQSNALGIINGQWWYATGFVAARILDGRVQDWKSRVFTQGFEGLLKETVDAEQ